MLHTTIFQDITWGRYGPASLVTELAAADRHRRQGAATLDSEPQPRFIFSPVCRETVTLVRHFFYDDFSLTTSPERGTITESPLEIYPIYAT